MPRTSVGVKIGDSYLSIASARNHYAIVGERKEFSLEYIGAMAALVLCHDSGGRGGRVVVTITRPHAPLTRRTGADGLDIVMTKSSRGRYGPIPNYHVEIVGSRGQPGSFKEAIGTDLALTVIPTSGHRFALKRVAYVYHNQSIKLPESLKLRLFTQP